MSSVNVFYENGYIFGYYDNDTFNFNEVARTSERFISVLKDSTFYYEDSKLYTSDKSGTKLIGAYHAQVEEHFSTLDEAESCIAGLRSAGFSGTASGLHRRKIPVRLGSYSEKSSASPRPRISLAGTATISARRRRTQHLHGNQHEHGGILFEFGFTSGMAFAVRAIPPPRAKSPGLKRLYLLLRGFRVPAHGRRGYQFYQRDRHAELSQGGCPLRDESLLAHRGAEGAGVAARNYAYRNIGKHAAYGFDLCSTTHCQYYGGTNNMSALSNQAVDETKGMVLKYCGDIADVYYHSCSGGSTETWRTSGPRPFRISSRSLPLRRPRGCRRGRLDEDRHPLGADRPPAGEKL
jgi:stage II sporulation protein D